MVRAPAVPVAVVGCGAISQQVHAPVLEALERSGDVRVVALVDPGAAQRGALALRFPNAAVYDDMARCPLGAGTLALIATPPRLHAEQAIRALRQGSAVLCEKPMAASVADAQAMLAAARETGGVLAIGIARRFFPAFDALRALVDAGPLGALTGFDIQEGGKFTWGATSDSFFRRDMTMGGVFFDVGVYVMDLLISLLGEPSEFAYEDDAMGGVEANCRLDLTYAGGLRGAVRLSSEWPTQNRYRFDFERGTATYRVGQADRLHVVLDGLPFALDARLLALTAGPAGVPIEFPTRRLMQNYTEQVRNVVAAIRGQARPRVPGEEALRSLRFIASCYENRRLMPMPWMTGQERAAAEGLASGPV